MCLAWGRGALLTAETADCEQKAVSSKLHELIGANNAFDVMLNALQFTESGTSAPRTAGSVRTR